MVHKYRDVDTGIEICFPDPREGCIPQETTIRNVRLAAAYVPFQRLCTTLTPTNALKTGTIFPELFSPYRKREFTSYRPYVVYLDKEGQRR